MCHPNWQRSTYLKAWELHSGPWALPAPSRAKKELSLRLPQGQSPLGDLICRFRASAKSVPREVVASLVSLLELRAIHRGGLHESQYQAAVRVQPASRT